MNSFKLAWRNVWRNRRRTLVTVPAMSLGLWVMILYAGLMEGYLRDMESTVLDLEVGDLQLFAGDYRENPSVYTRIQDEDALLASLDAAGYRATGRLLAFGLAAAEESSAGVSFRGVDPARDAAVSDVHEEVARGDWLDASDPKGVVIGRRLARTLAVGPGDEIVVLSQGTDGAMAYDLFRVRGVLRGIGDATDRAGVFLLEDAFRQLLTVPDGVHQIIVRRPDDVELAAAAGRVEALAGGLDVRTWRQLLPTLSSILDTGRSALIVMSVIIYLAIAILILNAMLMAVFERIREFGVLKALGVGPWEVMRLILLESAIQVGLAIAAGVLLAIPALAYLVEVGVEVGSLAGTSMMGVAMDSFWRAAVVPETFTHPIGMLIAIVTLAVLYPALKAGWIRPVEAMRHR